jgi:cytochrome c-type biogenesis protein CcmH/NrfG
MEDTPNPPTEIKVTWRPVQAYVMAGICLAIGIALGFFIRGSAAPTSPVTAVNVAPNASTSMPSGMGQGQMPTLEQMKQMADKQAEPLMKKLKSDPKNAGLWNQVGLIYKATHQFKDAEGYFQKSLEIDPKNVTVRADLASCMYYEGDVDGALAQLSKSLTYDPKSTGTLMNIGIIKWKGKHDTEGAVAAWQELLKQNPDFEKKALIQHMITEASQQGVGSSPKG